MALALAETTGLSPYLNGHDYNDNKFESHDIIAQDQ
jgi:hypothetical protein